MIEKGDQVECKRPKGVSAEFDLEVGRMYKVDRVGKNGCIYLIDRPKGYSPERFRKVSTYIPLKDINFEGTSSVFNMEDIQEKVCEFCRDHYDLPSGSVYFMCEGRFCEEAMELYLEDNNLKLKEEDDMAELNVNKNVMAVFGGNVTGNELEVINRHYTNDMLQQIVMKKHSKEVQAACVTAQKELDAEKKS
ncbi:hypothetical protein KAR91_85105 [Candidatus Pacearchaeota archaeon]|nr:hypothetical protein [Candidatus Pacearchaeota archaeon]